MTAERSEKILIIGDLPQEYLAKWAITSDLAAAEERLGVRVERIGSDELTARYENPTPPELQQAHAPFAMVLFGRIMNLPTFMGGPLESKGRLAVSHLSISHP